MIAALKILITYLSMLSLRSRKIYVFGAWYGEKFSDNSKYLFLEAIKDKSITSVWITKNKGIYIFMKKFGFKVYMYNSLKGVYYQLKASVYFTCVSRKDINALLIGNATRINLWHGVGLKKILSDNKINKTKKGNGINAFIRKIKKNVKRFPYRKEYILSTSDTMSKIFSGAFRRNIEKIWQLGQPRNDIFFDDTLELESFSIKEPGKKLILYMPTHRNEGKTSMFLESILDLRLLNEFCRENNVLFVIKKHFYHSTEKENLNSYTNVKDITQTEYDSQQLLKHTDILITDYSSCYVDYLLLDRPVIFYNYDHESYVLNDRDLYFDYNTTTPGEKVKNFKELYTALEKVLIEGIDPFAEYRQFVKNIFYSEDNQKKVGKKILEYVKENL